MPIDLPKNKSHPFQSSIPVIRARRSALARFLHHSLLAMAIAGTGLSLSAETFTLTDKQGRTITADVLSVDGDKADIRRDDGQAFTLDLSLLSDADRLKVKAWAAKEASKPLPPDAISIEMSRGIASTEKKNSDVRLVGGGLVKNGLTTTEEKWGYSVTLSNKTMNPIDNLRAEYRLFTSVDNLHVKEKQGTLRKKAFRTRIEPLPVSGRIVFRTQTISAFKRKYNGNIVSAKTGESNSRETLVGIWIRIYRGDELVIESAMPEKLSTTEVW